ncbi:hypothetical protein [Alkalicoccobacillus porphyridii]|uniref:Uncharacterized protein n=1 Tax=Alkalicoccobacillus porphyridii TaxID=2597270 RepID=A0A553ZZ17_9BACI|nr:hypothetical protein [Alkalicoccobacillus porphyridii]TSB46682.1 hypothetical protein FN960_10020 [Alkalicoccobacillus porphyridii]
MSKKLLYSMMAGIFSVGMLAACGGEGGDEMEPGTDPAQDPAGDEMGEEEPAGGEMGEEDSDM